MTQRTKVSGCISLGFSIVSYSGMLIGRPIAILYFMARTITAEGAEERRAFNRLFSLRVPLCTLRLNPRFGYSSPRVPGSPCTVKSFDSGFRYLCSYNFCLYHAATHYAPAALQFMYLIRFLKGSLR